MPRRCPADPTTPPISFPNASVSTLPLGLLGEQVSKCTKPGHLLHSSLALLSGPHGPTSHLADARSDFCRPRSSFLGPRSGGWAPGSRSPAPPITTGTTSVRLLGGRCHRRRQRRARRDSSRACREGRHCWILRRQRRLRQIWGLTAGLDPAVVIPDPVEGDDHRGGEGIGDYGRHGVRTWPRDATRRRGRRASAFSIVVSGYVRCCGSEDVSIAVSRHVSVLKYMDSWRSHLNKAKNLLKVLSICQAQQGSEITPNANRLRVWCACTVANGAESQAITLNPEAASIECCLAFFLHMRD